MVPYKVSYHKPQTVAEAIQLLNQYEDECKILAGGHSLIPVMKLRLSEPENLIDITSIAELKEIHDSADGITIGACATHGEIAKNAALAEHAPMVTQAAKMIGDVQVRNFGTIGGSIAHADPSADWPAILLAANAAIIIQGEESKRRVEADDFFQGLFATDLEENEIVVAIHIPKSAANRNSTYHKFVQPASRFALVGCAAAVEVNIGTVKTARVAFAGVSSTPFRDGGIENALQGKPLNADSIEVATSNTADGVSIMQDHFANEKYRKHLAGVYAKRALTALI
ncbi:MAG: xanthine dehydrogenase family protein subunit M [Chitinophagales bacterium]